MLDLIPLKYSYLTFCILFFIPWMFLFSNRKDLRKEMLSMGLIAGVLSVITAYFWTRDWWKPQTITGTRIGFEDFILGVSNGGIAAVLYEEIFHKRLYKSNFKRNDKGMLKIILGSLLSFSFLVLYFKIASFIACIVLLGIVGLFLVAVRKDLFKGALINGFLMALVALPIYYTVTILTPNFVEHTYPFDTLSGIKLVGVPVEEFIFYFWFGFVALPLYEYWQALRLKRC